jgi:hypothetical protein
MLGFLIDEAMGPVDEFVSKAVATLNIAQQGIEVILESTGVIRARGENDPPYIGTAAATFFVGRRQPRAVYQGNHLNQYAAFEADFMAAGYSRTQGAMIRLQGSVQQIHSEHWQFHKLMDDWFDGHRNAQSAPTVDQYNAALFDTLHQMKARRAAEIGMILARKEQVALGLSNTSFLSTVPRRVTKRG